MSTDERTPPTPPVPASHDRAAWNRTSPTDQWETEPDVGFPGGHPGSTPPLGGDSIGRVGRTWSDRAFAGEPQTPSYAGRGPKGWQRTDQRLFEDVSDALERDAHVDASEITVTVENGEVTLSGSVSERAQKRAAEDCADRVRGVRDVHNRLRVIRPDAGLTDPHEATETRLNGGGGER